MYWHCPNGHILGVVERTGKKNVLLVFRQSLPSDPKNNGLPTSSETIGDATIFCSICGAQRKWNYKKDKTLSELMAARLTKSKENKSL
jgi:hypothetical protein